MYNATKKQNSEIVECFCFNSKDYKNETGRFIKGLKL